MITCPTCGAFNDPGNRFCDQCGTRLEAAPAPATGSAPVSAAAAPAEAAVSAPAAQPTTATCPVCGASVLPGEAFCEECGAPLTQVAAATAIAEQATSPDAPTILAPVAAVAPAVPATGAAPTAGVTCPVCGYQNLPGDRFCDNCGAELTAAAPTNGAPPATELKTESGVAPVEPLPGPAQPDEATMIDPAPAVEPPAVAPPAVEPPAVAPPAVEPPAVEPPAVEPPAVEPPAVEPPAVEPPAVEPPAVDVAAEVARLEALATAHRDTIAQYEQMIGRYPAGAAPAFLTAGLDEAKRALAQAEVDLAALPSGPDPAEVARLEGLATAHRDTIAQYEQMIGRYPAGAAPAFLTAGLDEAKRALAQAEADLATLYGPGRGTAPAGAAPAASTAPALAPAPAAAPEAAPAPAAASAEAATPPGTTTPPPPTPAPAPTGPRLVIVEGAHELKLPADKAEIVVGREDPVSNIFPEIDLTPYGGESGGVSRQHARINHSNGQWTITDLNSTNYTRVDGSRLEPNTPTPLHDGARLQFGRIAATFHL